MAKQANILSFDDAKRRSISAGSDSARRSNRQDNASSRSRANRETRASRNSRSQRSYSSEEFTMPAPREMRSQVGESRPLPRWLQTAQQQTALEMRGFREQEQRTSSCRSAVMSYDDFLEEEQGEESTQSTSARKKTLFQKLSDARRKRTKEKAGKKFSRQFGDTSSSASEAGPRAAVYKGEMGASQRRAQRMQSDGSGRTGRTRRNAMKAARSDKQGVFAWIANVAGGISDAVSAPFAGKKSARAASGKSSGFSIGGLFGKLLSSRVCVVSLSVVACLAIAGAFMYPAAKQYYTEMRYLDQVQAEYDAVVARNQELSATRDYLMSEDGIAQTAHDNYNWVEEGENSVVVYGLPEDGSIADTNLYIKRGSVSAPETWYSVFLDPFFGVG